KFKAHQAAAEEDKGLGEEGVDDKGMGSSSRLVVSLGGGRQAPRRPANACPPSQSAGCDGDLWVVVFANG
ncbi:unnamed protein product, partial [Musa acuminata var. zebrina]